MNGEPKADLIPLIIRTESLPGDADLAVWRFRFGLFYPSRLLVTYPRTTANGRDPRNWRSLPNVKI